MHKIIVSEFLTLDGVMENPQWTFPYWNDEIARFKRDELFSIDALLLGRVTYQGFADAWPSQTDEEGYADRMNNLPKFVVSTTLQSAEWHNTTVIRAGIPQQLAALKEQAGGDILVFGSGSLVQFLRERDLVDQYNLIVYPLVLGKGKRLFPDGSEAHLALFETRPFSSGAILLCYHPDRSRGESAT